MKAVLVFQWQRLSSDDIVTTDKTRLYHYDPETKP